MLLPRIPPTVNPVKTLTPWLYIAGVLTGFTVGGILGSNMMFRILHIPDSGIAAVRVEFNELPGTPKDLPIMKEFSSQPVRDEMKFTFYNDAFADEFAKQNKTIPIQKWTTD